jgi:hypothetical protein
MGLLARTEPAVARAVPPFDERRSKRVFIRSPAIYSEPSAREIPMLVSLIISAALASQAPSVPPPVTQQPVTVTGQQPPGQPQKVCRWSGTGTLFPKRICMTPDEWEKEEGNAEKAIQQMREIQHGARCSDFRC